MPEETSGHEGAVEKAQEPPTTEQKPEDPGASTAQGDGDSGSEKKDE